MIDFLKGAKVIIAEYGLSTFLALIMAIASFYIFRIHNQNPVESWSKLIEASEKMRISMQDVLEQRDRELTLKDETIAALKKENALLTARIVDLEARLLGPIGDDS